ncbi:MAG: 50S ribosomal protein L24 [Spartobacteria bacterium]|nr:50S ribosomal protein L24 [Spartobacteria bacterium]
MKSNKKSTVLNFKKGDEVIVLSGEDKGKSGKVLQVMPAKGMAVVEGVNYIKKHLRKSQDNPNGGIVEKEAPMNACKLKKAE